MNHARARVPAAALTSLLIAGGCAGSSSGEEPARATHAIDGTWVDCSFDGVNDRRDVFVISGSSLTAQSFTYATSDGSCGGAGSTKGPSALSLTVGAEVEATFASTTVTASSAELAQTAAPFEVLHTILWRDTSETPDVLYIGDVEATAGLDGSTPGKRPTVLQDWRRWLLQTTPDPASAIGTWAVCIDGAGPDLWEMVTISSTTAMSSTSSSSTSTNGTCSGGALDWSSYWGAMALGPSVYATLAGRTVTALAFDTENTHSILWVDESVTPKVLFMGDTTATAGYDGTLPAKRPTVLERGTARLRQ